MPSVLPTHPFNSKEARVTGELAYEGGIIPDKLEVKNAHGKWEEVKLATMM